MPVSSGAICAESQYFFSEIIDPRGVRAQKERAQTLASFYRHIPLRALVLSNATFVRGPWNGNPKQAKLKSIRPCRWMRGYPPADLLTCHPREAELSRCLVRIAAPVQSEERAV
jgi:hypothetical protein